MGYLRELAALLSCKPNSKNPIITRKSDLVTCTSIASHHKARRLLAERNFMRCCLETPANHFISAWRRGNLIALFIVLAYSFVCTLSAHSFLYSSVVVVVENAPHQRYKHTHRHTLVRRHTHIDSHKPRTHDVLVCVRVKICSKLK